MQVSPVDIQAWASETGSEYPSTPAQKAAVLPQVAAWKAEQLADANASRGQNAISPLVMSAGAAGLGLAGLVAFNHFRKQGLSEPAAAALAKQAQSTADAEVAAPLAPPAAAASTSPASSTPVPASNARVPAQAQSYSPASGTRVAVAREANKAAGQKRQLAKVGKSPRLLDFAALSGANRKGTLQARARGEYSSNSLWNDPDLGPRMAAADTPELQQALLNQVWTQNPELADQVGNALADRLNQMTPVTSVANASKLPMAGAVTDGTLYKLQDTNEILVSSGSKWESASTAGVRARLASNGKEAYGSTTAEEEAQAGGALQQGRRTAGKMFQPGYQPDPILLDDDGKMLLNAADQPLYVSSDYSYKAAQAALLAKRTEKAQALAAAGKTAEAQALLDLGDRVLDSNTGVRTDGGGRENAPLLGYFDREDELTKGMIEALPASRVTNAAAEGWNAEFTHQPSPGGSSTYWGNPETGEPVSLLPQKKGPSLVRGMQVQTPVRATAPASRAYVSQVPTPESTNAYQGLLSSYQQQEGAAVSPALLEVIRDRPEVIAEQHRNTTFIDLTGAPLSREEIFDRQNPIPKAVQNDKGLWIAPLQSNPVLNTDGSPRFNSRPATVQDLIEYTPGNNIFDASPYRGKTSSEMAGAADTPNYDYTRELDDNQSAGSYAAALSDGVVTSADGKPFFRPGHIPVTSVEKAPLFQQGFILKESTDNYSRALAAANELKVLGGPPANVYSKYGVDQTLVDRVSAHAQGNLPSVNIRADRPVSATAKPVGGHTSADWLTQVLSGMAVTPRPDAWKLEKLEKGATREDSAALANGWLNANPGMAEVLSSNLAGMPAVEQLNLVQEALGSAAADFPRAVAWAEQAQPELAARAKLGGPGSFGFDQFAKSYVRRHVIGRVAQLKSGTGASASPLNLPAAVGELILGEAAATGRRPEEVLQKHISASASPIDAVWKLDGIVSDAATDQIGNHSYTNGSLLAERFWDNASQDTEVGKLKLELTAKTDATYAGGGQVPLGEAPVARLPIAVKFGTNLPIDNKGFVNQAAANAQTDQLLDAAVTGRGVTTTNDPNAVDESLAPTLRKGSSLAVALGQNNAARQFALNTVLKNQHTNLGKDIAQAKEDRDNGLIDDSTFNAKISNIHRRQDKLVARQKSIDTNRVAVEQGVASFNREGATPDGAAIGSGFVLDFHPRTGQVQVQPDTFAPTVSLEGLQRSTNPDDGNWDQDTLENTALDQGQRMQEVDPDDGVLHVAADDNRLSDADLDIQVAQGRENLTRAGYGEDWKRRRAFQTASLSASDTPRIPAPMRPGTVRSSAIPAAAQDNLNTLRSSMERSVDAVAKAKAGHLADYMDKLAAGGIRTSADGKRLVFNHQRQAGNYTEPGNAMVDARITGLRKRGII